MSDIKYTEEFKRGLSKALQESVSTGQVVGYDRLTVTPQGKFIPIDTGLQGVILSDSGKSTNKKNVQRDSDAMRDANAEGVFSLNRKFAPIFQDNAIVMNQGGRGSGKTKAGAVAILLETYKTKKRNILALRFNQGTIKDSIFSEVEALISKFDLEDDFDIQRDTIKNKLTESQILFKGIKAGERDVKDKLKGITKLSYVLIEEAADLNVGMDETIELIQGTMRDLGFFYRLHLIYNPRSKAHSIYKRFLSRLENSNFNGEADEAYIISTSYKDNKALGAGYLKTIEKAKELRHTTYLHTYLGQWQDIGAGQIIKNFEVGAYQEWDSTAIGVDFGFRDETACVLVSANHKTSTLYIKLLLNASELTAEDIKYQMSNYIDLKLIGDSARPEIIEDFKRDGFQMLPSKKGAGSVKDGLDLIQDWRIVIDSERAEEVVECFNGYFWDERRADKPNHNNSHIPDALRYAFMFLCDNSGAGNYFLGTNDYGNGNHRFNRAKNPNYKAGETLADSHIRRKMKSWSNDSRDFDGYGF
jgi:phage terminase large subunit